MAVSLITLKNVRTFEKLTLSGEYALNNYNISHAESEHDVYKGMGQIGYNLTASSIGVRKISISGLIFSKNYSSVELRDMKRKLARITNPLDTFEIIKDGLMLNCSSDGIYFSNDCEFSAEFLLKGTCHSPYFTGEGIIGASYGTYSGMISYPLVFKSEGIIFGKRDSNGVIRIINNGDLPTGCVISITSRHLLDGIKIENTSTREYIDLDYTISPNEVIIIDTGYGKKKVISVFGNDEKTIMNSVRYGSTFFSLDLGESVFTFVSNTENSNILAKIEFAPLYMWG